MAGRGAWRGRRGWRRGAGALGQLGPLAPRAGAAHGAGGVGLRARVLVLQAEGLLQLRQVKVLHGHCDEELVVQDDDGG